METEQILQELKKKKKWHHDIKKIDGQWIEDVVNEYQKEQNPEKKEILLKKIFENYAIYRNTWAKGYAKWLDNDIESGKLMHDEILWRSASKFCFEKCKKSKGYAFNAYLVSSQMNWLKNLRNGKMSHKNHPRVTCPICGEQVYQIDQKHLRHQMTLEKFQKIHGDRPLVSYSGDEHVDESYYTVTKFWKEHPEAKAHFPVKCPITGIWMNELPESYTMNLSKDYKESDFLSDFPDFKAVFTCPFTGNKKLTINQDYLDTVLKQEEKKLIRQVPVINPYTNQTVPELTIEMLRDAGVTVHDHVYKYKTIELNKKYADLIRCPYTGRRTYCITDNDLKKLEKTPWEFYMATCQYPLRKFEVKCICGDWVPNIWGHLEQKEHAYAENYKIEDFCGDYASITTRAFVSTNCFFESDSGDTTHISDLVSFCFDRDRKLEVEDSLSAVAEDEIDLQIVKVIRGCRSLEDVCYASATKCELPYSGQDLDMKSMRNNLKTLIGTNDFDVFTTPSADGKEKLILSSPSKDTIRKRLQRMIEASDLCDEIKEK